MAAMPEGFHTITPYIAVVGAKAAIAHYEAALGATSAMVMTLPGSDKVMHACLQLGTSKFFLCDENPDQGMPAPQDGKGGTHLYVYFDDVDSAHAKAVAAGMTEISLPTDMFWGDRMSVLRCKYGHNWTLATHMRDVSPDEIAEAMKQMCS